MYGWSYIDKYKFISKTARNSEWSHDPALQIMNEIKKRELHFSIINESVFLDFMEEVMEAK